MVEGTTTVTVSVISGSGPPHSIPESEMDALLLGRTKVNKSFVNVNFCSEKKKICETYAV